MSFKVVESTRWYTKYKWDTILDDDPDLYFIVWKYNHLFKFMEQQFLLVRYKSYPVNQYPNPDAASGFHEIHIRGSRRADN